MSSASRPLSAGKQQNNNILFEKGIALLVIISNARGGVSKILMPS